MTHTPRLPLVAAALVSLLAPLVLAVTGAQAAPETEAPPVAQSETAAARSVRLLTRPPRGVPVRLRRLDVANPPGSPESCCHDVSLRITATGRLRDVTVTVVESEGLYVDPMVTTIDSLRDGGSDFVYFAARATTTGLHDLTFEVTAPGMKPRRVTLPYLWRSGGAPLPGGDSLRGRFLASDFIDSYPCAANRSCTYNASELVFFRDATRAGSSFVVDGKPACGPDTKCPRYHYDKSTGLFQIGRTRFGRTTEEETYINGTKYLPLTYPRVGQRLDRRWLFAPKVDEGRGLVQEDLELWDDGRFALSYTVDNHRYPEPAEESTYSRTLTGTYRIGSNGTITFTDPDGTDALVATLALITTPDGRPRPHGFGIWLGLPIQGRDGNQVFDGNLLGAVRTSRPAKASSGHDL